jgi:predicted dehydrogenase
MLAAVTKAGVIHMICHNYRRAPAVMLAKQLIDDGKLGRLYHYRGTYLQDWVADPNVPLYWRLRKEAAGSGALGDIASHSLDLARFLVGEIAEVTGALETFVKERPLPDNPKKKGKVTVDDASASVVRFGNGALGTIEASRFATGRKNYNRFEINGSKGSVAFNLERMNELDVYLTGDEASVQGFHNVMVTNPSHPYFSHWWPEGHIIGYEHTFIHTVYDLLEAVAKDQVPTPNFEDGVKNQKVLDAMEKAAVTKRWVTV